jgi:hypothetical protein
VSTFFAISLDSVGVCFFRRVALLALLAFSFRVTSLFCQSIFGKENTKIV